jgi:hypothetical protein
LMEHAEADGIDLGDLPSLGLLLVAGRLAI